jgi:uncharacterized membrane protein YgcG
MRTTIVCLLFVGALLLTALHASAQENRWAPWLGCWERIAEDVRDGTGVGASADLGSAQAPRVCVTPAGPEAVRLTTTVPNQKPIEQTLTADGKPHPFEEGTCRGAETLTWSRNGQRLFARAAVECSDGPRAVSGLGLITPNGIWLDIRSVMIGDTPATRVSRYQKVGPPSTGRVLTASPPISLAEVGEIHANTSDAVLEAAIAETNPRLAVNARTLARLADLGVSPRVTDLMVALAYPDRFVVERTGRISTVTTSGLSSSPFGIDDYYLSGFYYPAYYYSPFGYSYIGSYDPYLLRQRYYGGVRPTTPGGIQPSGTARAISSEGYTRIRSTDEAQADAGDTGRRAVPRATSTSGSPPASGPSVGSEGVSSSSGSSSSGDSSSGGSGSASPEGFSGGGDGGRTAQPR